MDKKQQNFSIAYFVLVVTGIFLAQYFWIPTPVETISYSQFKSLVRKNQITDVIVREKTIHGSIKAEAIKDIFPSQKAKELAAAKKKEVVERPELQAILKVVSIDQVREKKKSVDAAECETLQSLKNSALSVL